MNEVVNVNRVSLVIGSSSSGDRLLLLLAGRWQECLRTGTIQHTHMRAWEAGGGGGGGEEERSLSRKGFPAAYGF